MIDFDDEKPKFDGYSTFCLKVPDEWFEVYDAFKLRRVFCEMIEKWLMRRLNTKKECTINKDRNITISK